MGTDTVADLVADFCRRSEIAPKTRTIYRDALSRFVAWAEDQGHREPEQLTADVVEAYARHLEELTSARGRPLAVASRRTYLRAVRQLLGWLQARRGVEEVDPGAVPMPRLRKVAREVLSRAEVQRLEDAAATERDKLLVRLMGDTAARQGEVAAIRVDDLMERDRRYHFVRLGGKTGQRLAPVRPELYRRLKAYAGGKTGRPRTRSSFLFMSSRRRPGGDYEPLTEDGVYQAVKDAVARAELGRRVYPHLLRHSAITWMVSEGMHPALISDVTGVSVAVIAAHYSHPSDQQRYEAMARLWE